MIPMDGGWVIPSGALTDRGHRAVHRTRRSHGERRRVRPHPAEPLRPRHRPIRALTADGREGWFAEFGRRSIGRCAAGWTASGADPRVPRLAATGMGAVARTGPRARSTCRNRGSMAEGARCSRSSRPARPLDCSRCSATARSICGRGLTIRSGRRRAVSRWLVTYSSGSLGNPAPTRRPGMGCDPARSGSAATETGGRTHSLT